MNASYVAGLFDGEGTLGAYYNRSSCSYNLAAIIANTHLEVLELIRDFLGYGRVQVVGGSKATFRLQIMGAPSVLAFLDVVEDDLIIKAPQAQVMRSLCSLMIGRSGRRHTPELRAKLDRLANELKALKRVADNHSQPIELAFRPRGVLATEAR